MNKILSFIRDKHQKIYSLFLFGITLCILVSLLPKEGKFKYEFAKSKPWLHGELIAPVDFAIQKSKEEIKQEELYIKQNNILYFKVDSNLIKTNQEVFAKEFAIVWDNKYNSETNTANVLNSNDLKQNTRKTGLELIDRIYSKGVIELIDEFESKSHSKTINLVINNFSEEVAYEDYFTLQTAFNFVQISLLKRKNIDAKILSTLIENNLSHSIVFDALTTKKNLNEQLNNISLTRGKIQKGERIISKGELIDQDKFEILNSLKANYSSEKGEINSQSVLILGQIILCLLTLMALYFFLFLFRNNISNDNLKLSFILLMICLMVMLASVSFNFEFIYIYALPFSILPIVIRTFYDTRLALFTHVICCLLIGFFAPNGFEFVFLQLIVGMFAIFSIVNLSKRSQLFTTALVVFATYSLGYIGFSFVDEANINNLNPSFFWWFTINALFTLSSYPIIYLFEKIYGFISDVTLMELSDTNSPVLRELASKAPGTFQHSLQVANLAEEAILEIGGDYLLVRTGALYHDIGKMDMPRYFIENQISGNNPHDELSFDESAQLIISHVIKGIEKAKKNKIPDKVIDFIRTHHGDSVVQYFYKSYIKQFPEEIVDENKFRYPGPRPYSKETAVLMMADSVEAASRSLKKHDNESIDQLVEKVINDQIAQNQFLNANITFKDITSIKKIFKKKLLNIYHGRIEYPK